MTSVVVHSELMAAGTDAAGHIQDVDDERAGALAAEPRLSEESCAVVTGLSLCS